jgi:hypothetical protein
MRFPFLLSAFLLAFSAGLVRADSILQFRADDSPYTYSGEAVLSGQNLQITLHNTSNATLAQLAFRSDADEVSENGTPLSHPAGPFADLGVYDFGLQVNLLANSSTILNLTVTGGSVDSVAKFFTAHGSGPLDEPIVALFHDGAGDHVVGDLAVPAPLPATAWAGMALFGVLGVGQRFRRSAIA